MEKSKIHRVRTPDGKTSKPTTRSSIKALALAGAIPSGSVVLTEGSTLQLLLPAFVASVHNGESAAFDTDFVAMATTPRLAPQPRVTETDRESIATYRVTRPFQLLQLKPPRRLVFVMLFGLFASCAASFMFGWNAARSGIEVAHLNGLDWSHTELIQHLKAEGLDFEAEASRQGSFWGPAMSFRFAAGEVHVQIRKSAQEAKDAVSIHGQDAFSWGRFTFSGDPLLLQSIQQRLR